MATEKATGWGDAANAYLINGQITTLDKIGNGFNANDGRTYFQGKFAQGFNQLGDNTNYNDGMVK